MRDLGQRGGLDNLAQPLADLLIRRRHRRPLTAIAWMARVWRTELNFLVGLLVGVSLMPLS